jgi:nucleoside-diphosphate-sugar epimerase
LPERYVPSTLRARAELGLEEYIDLAEAIRRTAAWHRLMPVTSI